MARKPAPFVLTKDKTALIVVDMQNDFVRVGAPMYLEGCAKAIPNTKRVIDACRGVNIPIIYLKYTAGPKKTLIWTWSPTLTPEEKCCWKNHRRYYEDIQKEANGHDIVEEIYPHPNDVIVEKYSYSGFYDTNLHTVLQAYQIEYTIILGCAAPICIDDTVSGAFDRQYKIYVVSDATGYFDEAFLKHSLRRIEMKYGRVLTTDELLKELLYSD